MPIGIHNESALIEQHCQNSTNADSHSLTTKFGTCLMRNELAINTLIQTSKIGNVLVRAHAAHE